MSIHRPTKRAFALAAALPFAFFGYSSNPVSAATSMCHGHPVTQVVTSHSAHTVFGTAHRDVILVTDSGHVIKARGGDDLVCGSRGDDVLRGGAGDDELFGGSGRDVEHGGPGDDFVRGNAGD